MTTFEQQWDAVAYNPLYWIAWGTMCVLPIVAAIRVSLVTAKHARKAVILHGAAAMASFLITAVLTVESIGMKWQARHAAASTIEEQKLVSDRDGAHLAFSPIIGGFYGIIAAGVEVAAALVIHRSRRMRMTA
jgi:cellobiose-specific phosphotransferase system component IIC